MTDFTSKQYKVYLTPRTAENTYGTEVEVSAEILFNGIKTMKKSIDSGDYQVGVYTYGDISLKVFNKDGKYNDEFDTRSIFKFSRDLAKIRVDYSDNDGDTTRFKGLINEEATRQDIENDIIVFRVLSNDSVLRTTQVSAGRIKNGDTAENAIFDILNQPKITSVLTLSAGNINVDQDFDIDDATDFDNRPVREVLNKLLVASNSVLTIDSSDNIIVSSRDETAVAITNLYGPFDEYNRQNIISVKKYNTGAHRNFTSVVVGGFESTDENFVEQYGYRQLNLTLGFITNATTKELIADRILAEFKEPKIELEVTAPTVTVKDVDLLDRVSLNYPLRVKRIENKFLPVIGSAIIGDTDTPLPHIFGNVNIYSSVGFKVIEISENPTNFETILKLRQYGYE